MPVTMARKTRRPSTADGYPAKALDAINEVENLYERLGEPHDALAKLLGDVLLAAAETDAADEAGVEAARAALAECRRCFAKSYRSVRDLLERTADLRYARQVETGEIPAGFTEAW